MAKGYVYMYLPPPKKKKRKKKKKEMKKKKRKKKKTKLKMTIFRVPFPPKSHMAISLLMVNIFDRPKYSTTSLPDLLFMISLP